jgi:hypothetical protein
MQDMPIEILTTIFLCGCDRHNEDPNSRKPGSKPIHRQLKPFARVASAVCRDWRDIAHSSSGRFWFCGLAVHASIFRHHSEDLNAQDITLQLARFKYQLQISLNCDLDICFDIDYRARGATREALHPVERISIYALLLLGPYARQIRSLEISTRSLEQIVTVINALDSMPRLEYFKLRGQDGLLNTSPDCAVVDPLLSPGYPAVSYYLDLSTAVQCDILRLEYWNILGGIKCHKNITELKLYCLRSRGLEYARWGDIRELLQQVSNLRVFKLDALDFEVRHLKSPTSVSPNNQKVALPFLKEVSLSGTDFETSIALFLDFVTPSLYKLSLILEEGSILEYPHLPSDSQFPPKQLACLPSLSSFELFVGRDWSHLHDECIDVLIPPRLEAVTIDYAGQLIPIATIPITVKSATQLTVRLRNLCSWANSVSHWSAENLFLHVSRPFFAVSSTAESHSGIVSMPGLNTLQLHGSGFHGICLILSHMVAPRLRSIYFTPCHEQEITKSPRPLPSQVKSALNSIDHLEIQVSSTLSRMSANELFDLIAIDEFVSLRSLTMTIIPEMVIEVATFLNEVARTGACPHLKSIEGSVYRRVGMVYRSKRTKEEEKQLRTAISNLEASREGQLTVALELTGRRRLG